MQHIKSVFVVIGLSVFSASQSCASDAALELAAQQKKIVETYQNRGLYPLGFAFGLSDDNRILSTVTFDQAFNFWHTTVRDLKSLEDAYAAAPTNQALRRRLKWKMICLCRHAFFVSRQIGVHHGCLKNDATILFSAVAGPRKELWPCERIVAAYILNEIQKLEMFYEAVEREWSRVDLVLNGL